VNGPAEVTAAQARAFLLRAHRIGAGFGDVGSAIAHLGYVQIDPINVCGRMHDHILRVRVGGYREGGLFAHLHGSGRVLGPRERTAFEHHHPDAAILAAFPAEAWPHLLASMRRRSRKPGAWSGRLTPREKEMAGRVLERIAGEGALASDAFADGRKGRRVWGAATLGKATMQKLFFHGRLLISGRDRNRRVYDLPERVLPKALLAKPEPSAEETERWLAALRLTQHRLVALSRTELELLGDRVHPVRLEGGPVLHCLREDAPLLGEESGAPQEKKVHLLAPLDPLIYDRPLTRRIWAFDYTWEAYTPPGKRRRGYYALPVLSGTEIVGHCDLKADREAGRLRVVSRKVGRGHGAAGAVRELSLFLGLRAR